MTLNDEDFYFRVVLNCDFYQEFHRDWFRFGAQNSRTLLLGPRDSLKCAHPLTLIPSDDSVSYLFSLKRNQEISSVFKSLSSRVQVRGERDVKRVFRVKVGPPFDFWVYLSPEHKVFCYDVVQDSFDVVETQKLSKTSHLVFLARPPIFNPLLSVKSKEKLKLILANTFSSKKILDENVLKMNTKSFSRLLAVIDDHYKHDELKEAHSFLYNKLQVMKFYHGLIKPDSTSALTLMKGSCLRNRSKLDRDKIAFLVDEQTDFAPSPVQVNSDFCCFACIEEIKEVLLDGPVTFFDCNVTNSHYIANGFVTHNSTFHTVGRVLHDALENPEKRYAIISATSKLAAGQVSRIQRICQSSPVVRYCFSDVINPREIRRWSGESLEFIRKSIYPEPTIWALGVGTDFTGFHFEEAYFDDLVTIRHRKSATLRTQTWDWFRLTAIPALDKLRGRGHVIGTRYHWDDMYGKLYEIAQSSGGWKISRTPALDEELLSQDIARSFWPERFPEEDLLQIRSDYGEDVFQLQYQCAAGIVLAEQNKQYIAKLRDSIVPMSIKDKVVDIVLGVDLASRGSGTLPDAKKASFSISATGKHMETGKFITLEVIKIKHPTLNDKKEWVKTMHNRYNPLLVAVEAHSQQSDFLEYLAEDDFPYSVKPVKSFESKEARFDYVLNLIGSGSLFFVEGMCQPLLEEMYIFPETTGDAIDSEFYSLRASYREPNIRFM